MQTVQYGMGLIACYLLDECIIINLPALLLWCILLLNDKRSHMLLSVCFSTLFCVLLGHHAASTLASFCILIQRRTRVSYFFLTIIISTLFSNYVTLESLHSISATLCSLVFGKNLDNQMTLSEHL